MFCLIVLFTSVAVERLAARHTLSNSLIKVDFNRFFCTRDELESIVDVFCSVAVVQSIRIGSSTSRCLLGLVASSWRRRFPDKSWKFSTVASSRV